MFLQFALRKKRGKRETAKPRFLVLRRRTLTVGAALLAARSHLRRGERARRRAGVGHDASAAHLLRRARPEGVQHLVRRRLG